MASGKSALSSHTKWRHPIAIIPNPRGSERSKRVYDLLALIAILRSHHARKVGPKGRIVIEEEFRDCLGVQPGWLAPRRLVDDHVEVYFVPPERGKSLN